jgi:predicted HTH transcriptional regulator
VVKQTSTNAKKTLTLKNPFPMIRAIAAMSNHRGGFLFYGISNKDHRVCGIGREFETVDIAHIMDKLKAYLSPTPRILSKNMIDLDGIRIGYIWVSEHPDKPVIVCRNGGDQLKEGEILFRYAGQS